MNTRRETKRSSETSEQNSTVENRYLVLYNDDYHTFDYVIDALMDICKHDYLQAAQCTFLVHYRGKYEVKIGNYDYLKPMKNALIERELQATID